MTSGDHCELEAVRRRITDIERQLSTQRKRLRELEKKDSKPQGTASEFPSPEPGRRFADIAVNFTDGMFRGEYRGKPGVHPDDRSNIVSRAAAFNVNRWMVTGGNLEESREAVAICKEWNARQQEVVFRCTVGCHPTRADEFETGATTIAALEKLIEDEKASGVIAAVGECGLDYDREEFCGRETQKKWFREQLELSVRVGLPLFLHNRNTGGDFEAIIEEYASRIKPSCSHSFTGTPEEAAHLLRLGLFVGINGCSLRADGEGGSRDVLSVLPLDRILLETDAPWCDIRPTHPSYCFVQTHFPTVKSEKKYETGKLVKSRQEPVHIVQVFEVVCGMKGIEGEERNDAAATLYDNAVRVYFQGKP